MDDPARGGFVEGDELVGLVDAFWAVGVEGLEVEGASAHGSPSILSCVSDQEEMGRDGGWLERGETSKC